MGKTRGSALKNMWESGTEISSRHGSHLRSDSRHFFASSANKPGEARNKGQELEFWRIKAQRTKLLPIAKGDLTERPPATFEDVIIARTLLGIWSDLAEGTCGPIVAEDYLDVQDHPHFWENRVFRYDTQLGGDRPHCITLAGLLDDQDSKLNSKMKLLCFNRDVTWASTRERLEFFSLPTELLMKRLPRNVSLNTLLVGLNAPRVTMIKDLEVAFQKNRTSYVGESSLQHHYHRGKGIGVLREGNADLDP